MKNASQYQKKLQKYLGKLKQRPIEGLGDDPLRVLIRAVLEPDAEDKRVEKACDTIVEEFVDYNELRVCRPKDLADRVGEEFPDILSKAESLLEVLNNIYSKRFTIAMDYMHDMTKRDLRRHLLELGLSPYASALLVLAVFDGHAIPVDASLMETLEEEGCIHPGSDLADVQGFLERVIPAKHAFDAHMVLREKVAKKLPELRKRRAELAAAAEAEARRAAEEARAAEEKKEQARKQREQKAAEREAKKAQKEKADKASKKSKKATSSAPAKKASTAKGGTSAKAKKAASTANRSGKSAKSTKTAKKAGKKASQKSAKKPAEAKATKKARKSSKSSAAKSTRKASQSPKSTKSPSGKKPKRS